MIRRMILIVFLIFTLAGCAAGPSTRTAQSHYGIAEKYSEAYPEESYSSYYEYDDTGLYDSYEKPAEKKYSEPAALLSPKQIQRALKNTGFYEGPIDGKIGPKTKEAIVKFQRAKGLKADGIVGRRTYAELNKHLSG